MNEKELLENILTADILILKRVIEAEKLARGTQTSEGITYAIREIKEQRRELIAQLISAD